MQIRWWPRSIRWQMLAGLLLLEALSIGLFAAILIRQQGQEVRAHRLQRLAHQATSVSLQAKEALVEQRPGWVGWRAGCACRDARDPSFCGLSLAAGYFRLCTAPSGLPGDRG